MAKTASRVAAKTATKTTTKTTPNKATPPQRTAQRASNPQQRAAKEPEPEKQTISRADVGKLNTPAVRQQAAPPMDPATLQNLPDFMRADAGMGTQDIGTEDMEIPRLKLIQSTSPELQEFNELRPGHFFHTAAEMIFDEGVKVVPITYSKSYILWRPLEMGGGILARADDAIHWSPGAGSFKVKLDKAQGGHEVEWTLAKTVAQSGLANWGTQNPNDTNSPPAATLMYNILFSFPEYPDVGPAVFTFQRSGVKYGRKFLTKLKSVRAPIFGTIWDLQAKIDTNAAQQDYQAPQMVGAGLVGVDIGDSDLYAFYKSMHEQYSGGFRIKDLEGMQDDPEGENATDGAY